MNTYISYINDYYPFGMPMPEGVRSFSSEKYRYGFNGQEKDDEVKGKGNSLDFGARIYDSRLGKFLSIDPMSKKFASESNYIFAGNNPVYFIDKQGNFKFSAETLKLLKKNYPTAYKYLTQTNLQSGNILEVVKNERIVNILINNTMHANPNRDRSFDEGDYTLDKYKLTKSELEKSFSFKSGPEIQIRDLGPYANGYNFGDDGTEYTTPIVLNESFFKALEDAKDDKAKKIALTNLVSLIINEYMEDFGADRVGKTDANGNPTGEYFGGNVAREQIFGGDIPFPGNPHTVKIVEETEKGTSNDQIFIPTLPEK